MSKAISIVSVLTLIVIVVLWLYVFKNNSGHTGLNLNLLHLFFAPIIIFGALKAKRQKIALATILFGILGSGSLVYLDRTNKLLEYSVWIERGMPSNNGN